MVRGQTPKAIAAAESAPSRATRMSLVNTAQVKAERAESAVPVKLVVKKLEGDAPPNEVPSSYAIDDENHLLFFNTYDEFAKYGSQIYSCSMKTATWTNITKSIKYLPPPLGSPERERQLPSRFGGAMAFYKSGRRRMLLLFGGQINGTNPNDYGDVSSDLIAVDVYNLKWWVVDVAGGAVTARVQSRLVVVGDQLFIFGGKTYINDSEEFRPTESYCVATVRNHQWTWDVRDEPYPAHMPTLGHACDATVIRDGDTPKILLTAGYADIEETTELLPGSFVIFDIGLRTFASQLGDGGTFPGSVTWYNVNSFPGSLKPSSSATSVVICTFHAEPSGKPSERPELYLYSLPPHTSCTPLRLRKRIAEGGKHNFELFTVVGSSMYMLGWTKDKWDIFAEVPRQWIAVEP